MPVQTPDMRSLVADKEQLKRVLDEIDKCVGFVRDPTATARRAREMMIANGVRPEERIVSTEIRRMREE